MLSAILRPSYHPLHYLHPSGHQTRSLGITADLIPHLDRDQVLGNVLLGEWGMVTYLSHDPPSSGHPISSCLPRPPLLPCAPDVTHSSSHFSSFPLCTWHTVGVEETCGVKTPFLDSSRQPSCGGEQHTPSSPGDGTFRFSRVTAPRGLRDDGACWLCHVCCLRG